MDFYFLSYMGEWRIFENIEFYIVKLENVGLMLGRYIVVFILGVFRFGGLESLFLGNLLLFYSVYIYMI